MHKNLFNLLQANFISKLLDMIWPDTNSLAPPHCSPHHFSRDWFELILVRVPELIIKILDSQQVTHTAQTSIQTHTAELIVHTRYLFGFFVSFPWRSPPLYFQPASPSTSTLHPLFFTTGRYELPARTPGNYGNSFSLDYWMTVAGRVPSGDFIIIIRSACT